jgi:hypothetical protein
LSRTKHTVRIKKEAPRRLVFEVLASTGTLLARSTPFATICKLEAGLSVLTAAARGPEAAVVVNSGSTTSVTPGGRRSRVVLEGELHPGRQRQLLAGILDATVVDDRPESERRADLSGPLCVLTD